MESLRTSNKFIGGYIESWSCTEGQKWGKDFFEMTQVYSSVFSVLPLCLKHYFYDICYLAPDTFRMLRGLHNRGYMLCASAVAPYIQAREKFVADLATIPDLSRLQMVDLIRFGTARM